MIAKLSGILDSMGANWAVIDVGGVGYLVYCSARTLHQLPGPGERVGLMIETHVREDHIHLYGFADSRERDWFAILQAVQGVGARVALGVLSVLSPLEITQAIAAQDAQPLTQASGVGAKLANRIVTELKDKVPSLAAVPVARDHGAGAATAVAGSGAAADAVSALTNLGYRRVDAFSAVASASRSLGAEVGVEALIRGSLKELGKMSEDRVVAAEIEPGDAAEASLRPTRLDEFIGQDRVRENLRVFIDAAKSRDEALDHVLFVGPPGLGKTTLAQIVARERGVGFRATSGPVVVRPGDLAALLTNLEPRDVLFIDEIHRLNPAVEEILYPAMEDFQLDLIIGEGPAARAVRITLPPFTLIGATTRSGLMTNPLRERFGIPARLGFYSAEELERIVRRGARVLGVSLTDAGGAEIARRSRGTPRVAGRLLRRVRDFASVAGLDSIDAHAADSALERLEVDSRGLDAMDRSYLMCIARDYGGGPAGIETIAAALAEPRDALEEVVEPFLIQQALVQRTSRGRVLTPRAFDHLGLDPSPATAAQFDLPGQGRGR